MKTTAEYVRLLTSHAKELQTSFGITSLCLFGSVARGEQGEDSDVDLFAEMPPSLRAVGGAEIYLRNLLGCDVDLVRKHKNLSDFFLNQVNRDGIVIY